MKNAHRAAHKLIWAALLPVFAAILAAAFVLSPDAPLNDELPELPVPPTLQGGR